MQAPKQNHINIKEDVQPVGLRAQVELAPCIATAGSVEQLSPSFFFMPLPQTLNLQEQHCPPRHVYCDRVTIFQSNNNLCKNQIGVKLWLLVGEWWLSGQILAGCQQGSEV